MVVVFIQAAKSLRVDHEHVDRLTSWGESRNRCSPNVNALRAGMDAWAHTEATLTVQENAVKKVTFASAVHACHRNYADRALNMAKNLDSFHVHFEFYRREQESGEGETKCDSMELRKPFTYCLCLGLP